jgi:hypothetical protein
VLPDVTLAAVVLRREQRVLDRVLATARRHPRLGPSLAGARAAHRAHVALLTRAVPRSARTTSPGLPSTRRHAAVPREPAAALAALARAEAELAAAGADGSLQARSGAFARLLGSMAAAAAQQSAVLGTAAADRR